MCVRACHTYAYIITYNLVPMEYYQLFDVAFLI